MLMYNFGGGIKDWSLSRLSESGDETTGAFYPRVTVWDSTARHNFEFRLGSSFFFSESTYLFFFLSSCSVAMVVQRDKCSTSFFH